MSGEDAGLYGERQCVAAGNVGAYLDAVISSKDTARIPHGTGTEVDGGDKEGGADQNTGVENPAKSTRKGAEKADTYSNYVRKNLKSGGTSKYLNRKTSRVSMAKQRWLNRSNDASSGGGGRYGSKYSRNGGKYQSSGTAEDNAFSGGGDAGNAYSKPRGLQQWGLDSLDMSLDLIATQISGAATSTDTTVGVTNDSTAVAAGGALTSVADRSATATGAGAGGEGNGSSLPTRSNPTTAQSTTLVALAKLPPTDLPVPSSSTSARASTSTTQAPSKLTKARSALTAKLNKATARMTARLKENERIQAMTALAPKCPGHGMASKLLVVKKSGPNKVTTCALSV